MPHLRQEYFREEKFESITSKVMVALPVGATPEP